MMNRWTVACFVTGLIVATPSWATETVSNTDEFHESWITANKSHQYLGLGSLALAGLAAIAPKEEGKSPHHYMALSAAYLGGAAIASGLTFHYRDLTLKNAWRDPDNLHALLAVIGTAGYFLAVNNAPNEMHPTYGMAGFASMALAIKVTW
jgi:hypothetical protein